MKIETNNAVNQCECGEFVVIRKHIMIGKKFIEVSEDGVLPKGKVKETKIFGICKCGNEYYYKEKKSKKK